MSEWISAETPPEEDGTYLILQDMTTVKVLRDEEWVPYPEPYVIELRECDAVYREWMATGKSATLYWQLLPEPPLEDMILDKLRGKQNFLVPADD